MIEKSPEAFRTISEVADELDLPQHVLRFWETRFSQIKPLKRGGGRRYYRPEDVNLLKGIRHLLYGEGYTIKGVQRILKEQGVRHVAMVWTEQPDGVPDESLEAPAAETRAEPVSAPVPGPAGEPPAAPATRTISQPARPAQVAAAPAPAEAPTPVASPTPAVQAPPKLSAEDVRQLKAALFELIECKRILDGARQGA